MLGNGECVWQGWEKSKSAAIASTVRLQPWHRAELPVCPARGYLNHQGRDSTAGMVVHMERHSKREPSARKHHSLSGKVRTLCIKVTKKKAYQMNK